MATSDQQILPRAAPPAGSGEPAKPAGGHRRLAPRFAAQRLRRHPVALAILALTLLGGVGLDLLAPLLVRRFIEQEVTRSQAAAVSATLLVAGFVAVNLLARLVSVAEAAVAERLAWTVMDQVRVDVTRHCLALGMDFHTANRSGELVERVDGDVSVLANFLSRFVLTVVGQSLLLVGLVGALVAVDWRIGASVGAVMVVAILVLRRLTRRGQRSFVEFREAAAGLSGFLGESLGAAPDVAGSGAGRYVERKLQDATRRVFRTEQAAGIWGSIVLWATASMMAWLGTAVALLWSAHLYTAGAITLGTVYLVFLYTQHMMQPLDWMASQVQDYQAAAASVRRLQGLLDLPLPARPVTGRPFPAGPVGIEFRRTSFRYSSRGPDVLRDVDVVVPAGESVGIVGRTGSGKSTLVRLLAGLYRPTGGAILLHGVDVTELDPDAAHRRLAVISQEVQLFRATLRQNVTIFDPGIPDGRIEDALHQLGMAGWLAGLADGLDTVLGPGGHELSAGEEQLVAFVRVILSDPAVVLLDEASSRLDLATERLLKRATTALLAGRTGLVVAHRLSTLTAVDRILCIEDGQVAEYGRRADLLRDPGSLFSRLLANGGPQPPDDEGVERPC